MESQRWSAKENVQWTEYSSVSSVMVKLLILSQQQPWGITWRVHILTFTLKQISSGVTDFPHSSQLYYFYLVRNWGMKGHLNNIYTYSISLLGWVIRFPREFSFSCSELLPLASHHMIHTITINLCSLCNIRIKYVLYVTYA